MVGGFLARKKLRDGRDFVFPGFAMVGDVLRKKEANEEQEKGLLFDVRGGCFPVGSVRPDRMWREKAVCSGVFSKNGSRTAKHCGVA
ncbi:MAG: hypothetical protein KKG34_02385, partial [Proteobacteria bacterium]|nr:hypothetical protein [Pseudomonadota bacterium]